MPPDRPQIVPQIAQGVAVWLCTGGVVLLLGWAFSVGGELRSLGGLPARVAGLEERMNLLEQQVARKDEALLAVHARLDRLERDLDGYRRRP